MRTGRGLVIALVGALTLTALALLRDGSNEAPARVAAPVARPAPVSVADGEIPELEFTSRSAAPIAPPIIEGVCDSRVEHVAARVRLRGWLSATYGLGEELKLRLEPLAKPDRAELIAGSNVNPAPAWRLGEQLGSEPGLAADDASTPLELSATADGWVDADVSQLFADPERIPRFLALSVNHENFEARGYAISARVGGERIDERMLAGAGELAIEFEFELVPRCVLRGQAWARAGGAKSIRVEAWNVRDGRLLGMHATDTVANPDDIFALQLVPDQRYALVALGDGLVPLTTIVYTFGALDLWSAPLVLDSGAEIDGHVALERHLFGQRASLSLAPFQDDRRNVYGPSGLSWNGAAFFPESVDAVGDAEGRFAFAGLVPGRYALRVGIDRARWTEMDALYDVQAPAAALELDPPLVEVTWAFEHQRRPLARHAFRVRGLGKSSAVASLATDGSGRASAWLLQGEPYLLEVPMGARSDWTYGKVVPWNRDATFELVALGSND